jgi:hypothetical protein
MLNRSSFLALAAITTLGVAALAPTSASAFGGHGGGFARGHVGSHIGGHVGGNAGFSRAHLNFGIRTNRIVAHNYHWNWRWRTHRYYGFPVAVGGTVATGAVYAATPRAPAATCNCLTKEYLPDGSLLFKDVCTNEAAMAAANQQAEAPMPQVK